MASTQNSRDAERKKRRKQKRRKRLLKTLSFLLCLCIVVLGVLCVTVFFPIETISVNGDSPYTAEEIIAASGIDVGDNVISAGRFKSKKRIETTLPYIKDVTLKRNLNGSLIINVKQAKEFYCFKNADENVITDSDLKILKYTDEKSDRLTVLTYAGICGEEGKSALFNDETDYTLFALTEEKIKEYNLDVSVIDISKSYNITILVDSRFVVELGNNANIDEKIKHLKTMISKIPSGETGIIELSAWNTANEEAYYREKDIKNYFDKPVQKPEIPDEVTPDESSQTENST